MSQFGAKNSPWGRAPGAPQQLNPNLFTGQVGLAHQFAAMPQAAMQLGAAGLGGLVQQGGLPVNVAAFSQPTVTSMSMQSLQQAAQQQAAAAVAGRAQSQAAVVAMQQQQQQQQQKNQRAFVGVVTKMQDNYGFVDDDVFFQVNVVRGVMPRIGDRVMVEANYNPNMPFKWNAFRIQLLPHQEQPQHVQQQLQQLQMQQPVQQQQQQQQQQQSQQQVPSGTARQRESDRWGPPTNQHEASGSDYRGPPNNRQRSPVRRRERSPPPARDRRPTPPRRSPPPRRRSPSPRRHGSVLSSSSLKRERSPRGRSPTRERESDSRSPPRRRQRIIPRYVVQTPKVALDSKDAGVLEVRKRYTNMYVPTDFFNASFTWLSTLRLDKPILLENATEYHIMHKDVDPLVPVDAPLDPPDADHRFSAKVMLLAIPSLADFYRKAFGLQEDGTLNEEVDPVAPSRLISFLVGLRGKNEVLAIGGPWSPSLDGADPQNDPRVLIRTAIRTTRALTGVDLSKCTQWYKFLELRYNRVDKERVDTVAIFVPDAWSAAPTKLEFEELQTVLRRQLDDKLAAIDSPPSSAAVAAPVAAAAAVEDQPKAAPPMSSMSSPPSSQQQEETDDAVEEATMDDGDSEKAAEATHWTKLDVKALKVVELRQELEARGLDKKGVKNVLAARLQEAIDKEKASTQDSSAPSAGDASDSAENSISEPTPAADAPAEPAQTAKPEAPVVEKKVDEKELQKQKEKEEREKKEKKSALERHYALPKEAQPGILVFPHKTAKGGKFECKTMTLNALLDYRQDDNKEHSFEVAMFAEAFNEMMSRNCAFGVYKALLAAVDKETEKKLKEDEKKKTEETEKPTENGEKAADAMEEGTEASTTEGTDDKKDEKKNGDKDKDKDKDKKATRAKEEAKNTTVLIKDPETFSAFAFFDTNLCGYLFERDAEEILHSLGLRLSRAQIQRLLKKVVTRDSLNYRKLTDVVINKDTKEVKSAPYKIPLPSLAQIAQGNNPLVADGNGGGSSDGVKRSGPPDVTDAATVIYQGSLVDVAQNLSQLRRMESEQKAMEQRNAALEKDLKSAKETRELLEKKKRRLEDDVDKYKKRLHDAEKCLKNSQDDTVQLKTAMQECKKMGEKMVHLVDKVMPSLVKEGKKSSSSPKKDTPKKVEAGKSEDPASTVGKEEENSAATNGEQETNLEELIMKDEISEEIDEEKAEVGGE